jgi:hypothetical protein
MLGCCLHQDVVSPGTMTDSLSHFHKVRSNHRTSLAPPHFPEAYENCGHDGQMFYFIGFAS